jgi:hypothetical protein
MSKSPTSRFQRPSDGRNAYHMRRNEALRSIDEITSPRRTWSCRAAPAVEIGDAYWVGCTGLSWVGLVSAMAFLIGVGASLVAGTVLWALTHPGEARYALVARRRRSALAGAWHSYHLTRDSASGPGVMWVHHEDRVRVGVFGRLHGTSQGTHSKRLSYALSGFAHGPTLRVTMLNREAHESPASIVYPNPLGKDVLVGILVGEDYDRQWYASPTVLSRGPLDEATLVRLAQQIRLNRASGGRTNAGPGTRSSP